MSHSIECVHCQSVLKVPSAVLAGTKVKCPKCKQAFVYEEQDTAEENAEIGTSPPDEPELQEKPAQVNAVSERPPRSKRRDDEEDEDVSRSRKRKVRDDDDEDEDDRPRPKKKKKKKQASNMMMVWALLGVGGFLGLFLCCGAGIGGYFLFFRGDNRIVGTWEAFIIGVRVTYTFRADGTGVVEGPAATVHITYDLRRGEPMVLETKVTRIEQKQKVIFNMIQVGMIERFNVTMRDDTMTLLPQNPMGVALNLKRMK